MFEYLFSRSLYAHGAKSLSDNDDSIRVREGVKNRHCPRVVGKKICSTLTSVLTRYNGVLYLATCLRDGQSAPLDSKSSLNTEIICKVFALKRVLQSI